MGYMRISIYGFIGAWFNRLLRHTDVQLFGYAAAFNLLFFFALF